MKDRPAYVKTSLTQIVNSEDDLYFNVRRNAGVLTASTYVDPTGLALVRYVHKGGAKSNEYTLVSYRTRHEFIDWCNQLENGQYEIVWERNCEIGES